MPDNVPLLPPVRRCRTDDLEIRWDAVSRLAYKPEGTHFQDITRQVLFEDMPDLPMQVRYFEVAPGGHSTLERHEHVHAVMILSGRGRVFVGNGLHDVAPFDLVYIPSRTWHQFRAADDAPLGFLCLVAADRDRPERPDADALRALRADETVGAFIRV